MANKGNALRMEIKKYIFAVLIIIAFSSSAFSQTIICEESLDYERYLLCEKRRLMEEIVVVLESINNLKVEHVVCLAEEIIKTNGQIEASSCDGIEQEMVEKEIIHDDLLQEQLMNEEQIQDFYASKPKP